ncbi:hypothetical protein C0585_05795 [Candidatus Woesearchaeota archaeon]|nr:MAG: hypothetical protein C0585_05795 [Candidatus Woesearchaeota archaeon]
MEEKYICALLTYDFQEPNFMNRYGVILFDKNYESTVIGSKRDTKLMESSMELIDFPKRLSLDSALEMVNSRIVHHTELDMENLSDIV